MQGQIGLQLRANRRSFDCASRDKTAGGYAQDDTPYKINQSSGYLWLLFAAGVAGCAVGEDDGEAGEEDDARQT